MPSRQYSPSYLRPVAVISGVSLPAVVTTFDDNSGVIPEPCGEIKL